ncbi:2-hydroxyacid dehydrogenase [Cryptococcus wingfieldii CBS 7118]|uniref:2-hydroxyacid dehydrogenase n=1 Tax=Cryptococcus wingfieldii CBS 7118 TaxID=1295528 RepID=A0A1E3JFM7_9TREE|nr:2-hydroxyacid dehydrogenase [Cryptococcus wingfieldii CBS 7118]ODN99627.1 2-hydroxyacid dehydrogenase [Cryptococcus wingfieldii CBS 7118]
MPPKPQVLIAGESRPVCPSLAHTSAANPKTGLVWSKEEQASKLGQVADVLELTSPDRASFFKDLAPGGQYGSIVGIYRHNDSVTAIGLFDKELVNKLPSTLKYICHNGAGYDQIDVEACTARGIQVSHTPQAVDEATATVGAFLAISAIRQFWRAEVNVRSGQWKAGLAPARDPEGKTLGIVGMGGIGSALARRLLAFDMKVIYYNRRPIQPAPDFPCTYVSTLDELLKQSDVVSLNLPLNEKTKGSFGRREFGLMKEGSVLVNTARGAVVDEEALIEALESGKLASAGIDVFPDEPNVNPKLVAMDNITLLPHMGTETRDTQKKMEILVLDNLVSALEGKGLLNQVAEQKL